MEIPAVQNLVSATLNPMDHFGSDASSITAQSTEPVASGGESATDDPGFDSGRSHDNVGSHLDEKA